MTPSPSLPHSRTLSLLHRTSRVSATVACAVGLAVLYGWFAHIPRLLDVFPGLVSMKANTALSIICCGASLLVSTRKWKSGECPPLWRMVACLLAFLPFLLGVLSGCESIFSVDFGIDQVLFQDPTAHGPVHPPGRMSPITAANFIYLGSSLMFLALRGTARFVQLLACCSGFLSLVVMTGTSYGLAAMVGNLHYTAVALHTNFCFILLFIGIVCATGRDGMMRLLTDSGTAGKVLRRLVPTAILVPLVVSSLTATLEHVAGLDLELGFSIFSIATIVAFTSLVWHSGVFLHRSELAAQQTEDRLRESLRRYAFLADAMPEMVWTATADGRADYFNQRWLQYTGLALEECRNSGWQIVLHPDDLQRSINRWNEAVAAGRDYEIEYRLKAKDGSYRWFMGRGFPMRDGHGRILQWVGNCADIDDQKRAREELERRVVERTAEVTGTRERLQAVLDSATQVAIIAVDTKGWITLYNRGAEQMFGYAAAELVGKHNPSIFHLAWEVEARAREMSKKYGRDIHGFDVFVEDVRHGQPVQREWTLVRKDGSRFPAELMITAMHDGASEIIGFLGLVTDLTARKNSEKLLHDQAVILDLANESIFIRDVNDLVTYWNHGAERLYGWTRDEARGRVTHELLQTVFPQPLVLIRGELLEKGSWEGELIHTTRDGAVVTVASSWTLQRDETGEPISVIEINHDITARKAYEKELQDAKIHAEMADRAKSNFLANMSHEIRTPMNGVIGLTGLLLETGLDAEQRNLSQTIRGSAESLLGVINDILDFSKIEAGKLTIEEIDFDLRKVVEDSVEVMASLALNKGLELTGGVEPGTPTRLRGDPTRVQQVLTNLLGNALKFTTAGEVALRVRAESESPGAVTIRCEVRDTGLGIAPGVQARLFQPFVQGDTSTSRQFGGTGLGLAICKRLAEAMNGRIGVTSSPGQGSTFWITLEFPVQGPPAADPPPPDAFAHARVLIVDDNAASRTYLQHVLASWRLRNDPAADADLALDLLRRAVDEKSPYGVAIVDLRMPDIDGLALTQLIYADPLLRATRVILLTPIGKPLPSDEIAPLNLAACCMKPVRQSALFDALAQALTQPAAKVDEAVAAILAPPRATPALPARQERLLLAEDNPVNQEVALGNLRKLGYHADVATNGLEVLDAIETKPYDIILMDCQMPELDGYEATRQIRLRERGAHRTRIIAMTANAMVGDREKCLAAGMDDYVSKPLDRAQLRAALDRQALKPAPPLSEKVLRGIVDDDIGELARLIDLFNQSSPPIVTKMRDALAAKNAPQLALAAHTLKGSCGSLGATTLRDICALLEKNARDGQLEGADELIASTDQELHRFSQALATYTHQ
jgi:PAS domain S-box-containing protein